MNRFHALWIGLFSSSTLIFSRCQSAKNESVQIRVNLNASLNSSSCLSCFARLWLSLARLAFTIVLALAVTTTTRAKDGLDPTESYRATDEDGKVTRITPDYLGGYRSVDQDGKVTRISPDGLGSRSPYDRP
ncbi:MAG: hypothetical protein WD063_06925 [Pirellulales bacterium]